MKKKDVFEQLADNLDDNERKTMLDELKEDLKKHQKVESKEPEKKIKKEKEYKLLESEYHNSTLIDKIQLFLKKILTGKSIYDLMREKILKNLGKSIEHDYPGFVDIKESRIKEPYCNEINLLNNSLSDLRDILFVIENYGKAEFYQFIAASEMSALEKTLENNTNPDLILRSGMASDRDKVRNEIIHQYHEIIESVDSMEKEKVYEIIRGFFLIKKIIDFKYNSFQSKIEFEPNGNKFSSFGNSRKFIREIYEIIFNISKSPAPFHKVLKYMAEFHYEKGDAAAKVAKDEFMAKMLNKLENDFKAIETFRKNTPLKNLIKYLYKDLHYEPGKISGGEEWFNVYKNYLKDKIDNKYDLFINEQKKNDILRKIRHFIDTLPEEKNINFKVDIKDRIYKFDYAVLLFYLKELKNTFYQKKMDRVVSAILLDGIFYKDANKKELYEAYNFLNNLDNDFRTFQMRIDPEGDEVKSIRKYTFEETSIKLQKKKTERFIQDINNSLYDKYTEYYDAFLSVSNVLYGIVNGNVGGKYDTLSNTADVCEEKTFMSLVSINTVNNNLKELLKMFNDLTELYGSSVE